MAAMKGLRMVRGSGENARTHYICAVVDRAKKEGLKVLVAVRNRKTGQMEVVPREPRSVHRSDITEVFCDTHPNKGKGKYIDARAYPDGNRQRVVGAQYVNPYLQDDGCYAIIVETFKKNIGLTKMSRLQGDLAQSREMDCHILWQGRRDAEQGLAYSEWFSEDELLGAALAYAPQLASMLRKSKSGRSDVSEHMTAQEKFAVNLNVMRRVTCSVNAFTGERTYQGGCTPDGMPLEQAGYAIDRRWMTWMMAVGKEYQDYFYRLVIGRPEPHDVSRLQWKYLGADSPLAYVNKVVQRQVQQVMRNAS